MRKCLNILIADDHRIFADGLASLLNEDVEYISTIYIAENGTQADEILTTHDIALAFLDIELGVEDGRDLAATFSKKYANCKYVALSSHSEPQIIKSSLKGAFNGYVLKTDSLNTIIECIEVVLRGEKYISPNSGTKLLDELSGNRSTNNLVPKLTRRERQILDCIASEKSTKEIAADLFISEKTVEAHRSNLMLKLDAKNAAGLIRKAFETGLLN